MKKRQKDALSELMTKELFLELLGDLIDSSVDFGMMPDSPVTEERFEKSNIKMSNAVDALFE
jgi:hypothetical protein